MQNFFLFQTHNIHFHFLVCEYFPYRMFKECNKQGVYNLVPMLKDDVHKT